MTKIAADKQRSLRILFAFKPERFLKGETRKRHDLFPRCKRFFSRPDGHERLQAASLCDRRSMPEQPSPTDRALNLLSVRLKRQMPSHRMWRRGYLKVGRQKRRFGLRSAPCRIQALPTRLCSAISAELLTRGGKATGRQRLWQTH